MTPAQTLTSRRRIPQPHPTTDHYFTSSRQDIPDQQASTNLATYYWSPTAADALIARDDSAGTRLYATYDATHSVTGIVNTSGTVVQRELYDAYGTQTPLDASFNPIADNQNWLVGYQGLLHDTATGLWYNRARWYSDSLMRFINLDPAEEGMNWYASRAANPIKYRDPSGLARLPESDLPNIAFINIQRIEKGLRSGQISDLDAEIEKMMKDGASYDQADTVVQIAAEHAGVTIGNPPAPVCPDPEPDLLTKFVTFVHSHLPFRGFYTYAGFGGKTPGTSKVGAGGEVGWGVTIDAVDATGSMGPEVYGYGNLGPLSAGGAGWFGGGGAISSWSIGIFSIDWVYDPVEHQTYLGFTVGEGVMGGMGITLDGRWP